MIARTLAGLALAALTLPAAAGYTVTQDEQGRFWLADSQGSRFLSLGVSAIEAGDFQPRPGSDYYSPVAHQFAGDAQAWERSVVEIMGSAGLNTIGAWSSGELNGAGPHETIMLYAAGFEDERVLFGLRPDFEEVVRGRFEEVMRDWPNPEHVIGFFLDNEARWYGDSPWTEVANQTLLEQCFAQEAYPAIRGAALAWLQQRYPSAEAFGQAWHVPAASWGDVNFALLRRGIGDAASADRAAFIEHAADEWFRRACAVVRELAPGKLILGVRFAGHAPEGVVRACGRHCDVISLNDYRLGDSADPDPVRMAQMWVWGGKPLMITEYSWRARENQSGCPNTGGAGTVVDTQAERGRRNTLYLEQLFAYPHVIGAHWFAWADQSPQGRFDGEDSNYGIVDIHHGRYEELIAAMADVNGRVEQIHAASTLALPASIPEPPSVIFEPGQRPERPPSVDLLSTPAAHDPDLWHAEGASITMAPGADGPELGINTGEGSWGCGVSIYGPREWTTGTGTATDLDGYTSIVLDATVPADISFRIYLEEASVGPPGQLTPPGAIDDGESFTSDFLFGTGTRTTYAVPIGEMEHRGDYGNQSGGRRIDMRSMKGLALYFPNGQGAGTVRLHSLRLER